MIIADAGKPVAKLIAVEERRVTDGKRRLGFVRGQLQVPGDFDTMGREEIEWMFYGDPD